MQVPLNADTMFGLPESRRAFLLTNDLRADVFSRELTLDGREELSGITHKRMFLSGVDIFAPGDLAVGVYIHVAGRALLSVRLEASGNRIERLVDEKEVFGLTEILADQAFATRLKTLSPCIIKTIKKEDLARFLLANPTICFDIVKNLGSRLQTGYQTLSFSTT